jgi:hypothetical protein
MSMRPTQRGKGRGKYQFQLSDESVTHTNDMVVEKTPSSSSSPEKEDAFVAENVNAVPFMQAVSCPQIKPRRGKGKAAFLFKLPYDEE